MNELLLAYLLANNLFIKKSIYGRKFQITEFEDKTEMRRRHDAV